MDGWIDRQIDKHMIVDQKVHVAIVHETPAEDKRGVCERFAKVIVLFAENGRLQIEESRSNAIYVDR